MSKNKDKEEKYKDKNKDSIDIDDRELINETKIDINELSESYIDDIYYENIHECVVESLNIIKMHIKEKSLRMGQKIEYGDIFDFLFN